MTSLVGRVYCLDMSKSADEAVRARLATVEIKPGRMLLESADWFLANAGNAGKTKMLKQVRAALAA